MLSGIEISDGTTSITIPPPNLRITDEMEPERLAFAASDQTNPEDRVAAFLVLARKMLLMCARRNYPDMSKQQFDEFVPPAAVMPLYTWAMTKGGLEMLPLALRGESQNG